MRPALPVLALFLTACSVGPPQTRPQVAGSSAAAWHSAAAPGEVDPGWWQALGDPLLDRLVADAAAANPDIRTAVARLREARALRDVAAGGQVPDLGLYATITGNQLSRNGQIPIGNIPGFNREFMLFDGGFDASWEIDLWGATRASIAAAEARRVAGAARLADASLAVTAEVVRSYADLRAAQARLASLEADAGLRAGIAGLSRERQAAGEAPLSEAAAATRAADEARGRVAGARADVTTAIYRLALLTGRPPEALVPLLSTPAPLPAVPASVAAGLRSDLLRRRPDIRAAEAELSAAISDVGVATADLYPSLSLVGAFGAQAQNIGAIAKGSSTWFQVGPSFSWPILAMGRVRAQIRASDARAEAAAVAYEKAVLGALNDSETAINRLAAAQASAADSAAALSAAETGAALAGQRFAAGEDSRITALEAQSGAEAARLAAIAARADALTAYVALAKALGGGWPAVGEPAPAAVASVSP